MKLDTSKNSVAHVMFRLVVGCGGCELYFKTSEAVDNQGVQWNLTDITRNTRHGFGGGLASARGGSTSSTRARWPAASSYPPRSH